MGSEGGHPLMMRVSYTLSDGVTALYLHGDISPGGYGFELLSS